MIKPDINLLWDFFNEEAFEGVMVRPAILVYRQAIEAATKINGKPTYMYGAYHPPGTMFTRGEILLWGSVELKYLYDTLVHEMAHQYVHEILLEPNVHHGQLWKDVYLEALERLDKLVRKL